MKPRVISFVRLVAINIAVLAALLIVAEGAASWFLVARDVIVLPWVAEPYTRYDPQLGWVNKPNVDLRNMFGTGAWVRTNAQSFRNAADTPPRVAAGRYRVVCSGDSFTFGDGVDNDHTWCQQLAAHDPRIDAVNLGEGGYGADQAYLRYMRDARDLQHHVHVFAFISNDFVRMEEPVFLGFGKPVLAIDGGELVTRNVPVPSLASKHPWIIAIPRALKDTRIGTLIDRIQKKYGRPAAGPQGTEAERNEWTRAVIRLMFAALKRASAANGSTLVLLYQPVIYELDTSRPNPWTRFLEETAREQQILFVNVLDEMRSYNDAQGLFLQVGTAAGHYSNAGHAMVAERLSRELSALLPAR
jgi:hypothetical protein